jgi:hypothetical protein
MEYCAQHDCDGLFTNNLELIALYSYQYRDKKPLYSAKGFKPNVNDGCFEAKKYKLDSIIQYKGLSNEQFCWFTVLLGTRWFSWEWLEPFYLSILPFGFCIDDLVVTV